MYRVICGFPGVGKTTAAAHYPDLLVDYQLSHEDPIVFVQDLISRGKVVLLPTDLTVMNRLEACGIDFMVVYPDISLKFDYLERCTLRGDDDGYLHYVATTWIDQYFVCHDKAQHHPNYALLNKDQTLLDVLRTQGIV